jgi:triosephosphate isomerase
MTRKILIAANWKMNKTVKESLSFIKEFKSLIKTNNEIVIAPPFTALEEAKKAIKNTNIKLAAQNMHQEEEGAFTGEISAGMVKELCEYVILGHSERRQFFGETNKLINKKIQTALKHKLKVILCIGETLEERESNKTMDVIKTQIEGCLNGMNGMENITIAYEPIWAIGTGKTATTEQAEEVHKGIRELLSKTYDKNTASKTLILYGGSVKPSNIENLIEMENIDGALVGGASLEPKSFSGITNV